MHFGGRYENDPILTSASSALSSVYAATAIADSTLCFVRRRIKSRGGGISGALLTTERSLEDQKRCEEAKANTWGSAAADAMGVVSDSARIQEISRRMLRVSFFV